MLHFIIEPANSTFNKASNLINIMISIWISNSIYITDCQSDRSSRSDEFCGKYSISIWGRKGGNPFGKIDECNFIICDNPVVLSVLICVYYLIITILSIILFSSVSNERK